MKTGPLDDKTKRARRYSSFQHRERFDTDYRFEIPIDDMKVRRLMLPVVHINGNAIKV
jgi:hypothetical protein